jgi:hypothetical protein
MARYISRASKKPKKSKVIIFLNIVIGMLTAFVIFFLIGFFSSERDNYYSRKFGDSMTSYNIERGQYAQLINEYNYDYGAIGSVNSGYEDAAAVAEYAMSAFRYKAYLQSGDSERAAVQKQRMEKAAAEVGIYEPELSKIDSALDQ